MVTAPIRGTAWAITCVVYDNWKCVLFLFFFVFKIISHFYNILRQHCVCFCGFCYFFFSYHPLPIACSFNNSRTYNKMIHQSSVAHSFPSKCGTNTNFIAARRHHSPFSANVRPYHSFYYAHAVNERIKLQWFGFSIHFSAWYSKWKWRNGLPVADCGCHIRIRIPGGSGFWIS